jgi:hypothetical protein
VIQDHCEFDVSVLSTAQLAHILDANPFRPYDLQGGTWTAVQSEIWATRPYPVTLRLSQEFRFHDGGTAFVEALHRRPTSFGWLYIDCRSAGEPFSSENWNRFLRLEHKFQKLSVRWLDGEHYLVPFALQVKALEYNLDDCYLAPENFTALDIVTHDLALNMIIMGVRHDWKQLPMAFLRRVAELGHFEQFEFSLQVMDRVSPNQVEAIAEVFIRAIQGNVKLTQLTLGGDDKCMKWDYHLQSIFQAVEVHPNLRTFILRDYTDSLDPDFSWLKRLLSRNRRITVLDLSGERISNGTSIDELYALNRIYNGSVQLIQETGVWRPNLLASALTESVSSSFQHAALLLSDHTDALCGFFNSVAFANISAGASAHTANVSHPTGWKRKTRLQPSHVVKKALR